MPKAQRSAEAAEEHGRQSGFAALLRGDHATTATIDDDVLAVARALAEQSGSSLGHALSELARRGFKGTGVAKDGGDGVPVFQVPADAGPIIKQHAVGSQCTGQTAGSQRRQGTAACSLGRGGLGEDTR